MGDAKNLDRARMFLHTYENSHDDLTPTMVARWLDEAEARGRAARQAECVALLRAEAESCRLNPEIEYPREATLDELADAIERGEAEEK